MVFSSFVKTLHLKMLGEALPPSNVEFTVTVVLLAVVLCSVSVVDASMSVVGVSPMSVLAVD